MASVTEKPRVLVTDGINEVACQILGESCEVVFLPKLSADELLVQVQNAHGLMVRSASQITEAVLAKGAQLQIVGRAGVGTDNIDLKAATRSGVIVVNSPGGNTVAAAEHTIGMMMALARHIPQADRLVKSGGWRSKQLTGIELAGKTLGVVGFGKIGRRVAQVFQRVGMRVCVFDPFLSSQMADELKIELVDLGTLYAQADFITLHAPKTPETHHLLNATAFSKMKPGVRIVNCARGGIINEADLITAIHQNIVAGVALDVFEHEPLPADSPLLALGDVVITTPHLGASTEEAQVNVARDVAEQILEYFQTGVAQSAVNIPALRKEVLDPVRPYMPMAEQLGNLVRQLFPGGIQQVELVACGTLASENLTPLTLAALKGVLGYAREGVNYVNAMVFAEEEGIQVKETRLPRAGSYANLLTVNVLTDTGAFSVSGSLITPQLYRIVDLDGYPANIEPSPFILFTPHVDRPGMIAKVATILGDNQINVSALQVARKGNAAGGQSMMIFNLDSPPASSVLKAIEQLEGFMQPKFLTLSV